MAVPPSTQPPATWGSEASRTKKYSYDFLTLNRINFCEFIQYSFESIHTISLHWLNAHFVETHLFFIYLKSTHFLFFYDA